MLRLEGVDSFYGTSQVLFAMALEVGAGEVVSLMGRNGMGKTTTVRSIMGLLRIAKGSIVFDERRIERLPAYRIAKLGLGLVPEGRQIFPNLTVRENLLATAMARTEGERAWTLERVLDLFPALAERQRGMGDQLSGGEQQMLAIGRALMLNPRLLILDEATEGLAPLVRDEIWRCLADLKASGQAILVIDKNVEALARIGDRHYIIEKGSIAWSGSSDELRRDAELKARYLGV